MWTNHRGDLVVSAFRELEVMGLIRSRDRPKSLKLVVMSFPLGAQGYGNNTTTGPPVSGLNIG